MLPLADYSINNKIQVEQNLLLKNFTNSKNTILNSDKNKKGDKSSYGLQVDQPATAIFAAAAVATAATLTVISSKENETVGLSKSDISKPRPNISWAQYASQRRSSLQRRKLEISKKLEKATNAAKDRKDCTTQFQQKQIQEKSKILENDKKQKMADDLKVNTIKFTESINLNDLNQSEYFSFDPNNNSNDKSDINGGLLDYLYTNDFSGLNPYDNAESYLLKKETLKRKREEKINYILAHKWDPRWLKALRNRCCLPLALLTLIFLIFTNINSNWIRFDEDTQRAGLWTICNKSSSIDNTFGTYQILVNSSLNNENNTKTIDKKKFNLISKIKDAKTNIQKKMDVCYSKFYLKEETHLAIFCLSMISFLFHTIGLILLTVGILSNFSDRKLYFFHSAGECLITSAIVDFLYFIAFVSLVESQLEQTFKYGLSVYLHLLSSSVTLICSVLLNLDDLVNEYRIWKIKTEDFKNTSNLVNLSI